MENNRHKRESGTETHTTALVLLVLFTALVLVVALGDSDFANPVSDTPATSSPDNTQDSMPTRSDLLAGIPVDEDAVVENRMITRGGVEAVEQVITFETELGSNELTAQYKTWMSQNNFQLAKERVGERAASMAATRGNNALIVLISHLTSSNNSRVEIINYKL